MSRVTSPIVEPKCFVPSFPCNRKLYDTKGLKLDRGTSDTPGCFFKLSNFCEQNDSIVIGLRCFKQAWKLYFSILMGLKVIDRTVEISITLTTLKAKTKIVDVVLHCLQWPIQNPVKF